MTSPGHPSIDLLRIARDVDLAVARVLEPHGLSLRKYGILRELGEVPGLSTRDLARRQRTTPDDLRVLLRSLTDVGHVKQAPSGSGHEPLLALTPAGSRALVAVDAALTELDGSLFAGADRAELAAAVRAVVTEPVREPQD
ncbi:MarR family winged helix-turn-helix transcriptional regulator [Pseudolysinimonas sp.]|uniref:MarR family winged helix-turn-helix transcriptional regulator n=1 Tax=Pseudolysinimonas sp. TaxID=2680009 RepID=UPI003F7EBD11